MKLAHVRVMLCAAAALLSPAIVSAQTQSQQSGAPTVRVNRFLTGADLLALCRNDATADQRTQCNAYILGVVEALNTEAAALHNIQLFCFSRDIDRDRFRVATVALLDRDENARRQGAATAVLRGVREAFPCS
jgi:hypothetical protein